MIAALERADGVAASARFDAKLRSALPPQRLVAIWQGLKAQHGSFAAIELFDESRAGANLMSSYELLFARAVYRLQLRTDTGSGLFAGIFFRIIDVAPTPQGEGAAHTSDAAEFRSSPAAVGAPPYTLPAIVTSPMATGRHPAAVLVPGSGPGDRDEHVLGMRPFKDLAEGLARRGIVSLRYDKRTLWYPDIVGNPRGFTVDEEVIEDALSAISVLQALSYVDARRIYVIGHSLGALLAPEIAKRCHCTAGIVMLAPPGRPVLDVLAEQLNAVNSSFRNPAQVSRQITAIRSGALADNAKAFGATAHYYRDLESRNEIATALEVRRPLLVIRGESDRQVTQQDEDIWRDALRHTTCAQVEQIPRMTHQFAAAPRSGGTSRPHAQLLDLIASFVSKSESIQCTAATAQQPEHG